MNYFVVNWNSPQKGVWSKLIKSNFVLRKEPRKEKNFALSRLVSAWFTNTSWQKPWVHKTSHLKSSLAWARLSNDYFSLQILRSCLVGFSSFVRVYIVIWLKHFQKKSKSTETYYMVYILSSKNKRGNTFRCLFVMKSAFTFNSCWNLPLLSL